MLHTCFMVSCDILLLKLCYIFPMHRDLISYKYKDQNYKISPYTYQQNQVQLNWAYTSWRVRQRHFLPSVSRIEKRPESSVFHASVPPCQQHLFPTCMNHVPINHWIIANLLTKLKWVSDHETIKNRMWMHKVNVHEATKEMRGI